ncbi:helix-turn-helix domain-containing protein [Desulfurivibrio alkaliphilus]|uniref:helix-turn-helix domain-containing protein n=1 Tax=Desulfurivibrio alkaliphilus TaxID=427923 RepID=UPI0012FF53EF|nr:helix-turn-helix domain-containing protein [Desulfurivibrio alkaliphilus]
MRKIYEILRLKYECRRSLREIATSCGVGKSTVSDYLLRFKAAGLQWPLPAELDEVGLNRLLFREQETSAASAESLPTPDWSEVQRELRGNRHVTLALLWQEYKERHPEGMQYSCQWPLVLTHLWPTILTHPTSTIGPFSVLADNFLLLA